MTRIRAIQLIGLLVVFMLIGWGVGALVTSVLTPGDLHAVRDIASDRTATATVVAHVFSWIGSGFVVFPVALAFCVTLYRRRQRAAGLAVAISTVGAQVIIDLDKLLVGRHRPPLHRLDHVTGHSFPSGHTGQTSALCVVLVIEALKRWGPCRRLYVAATVGALLVTGVAFSRVYLGVHYPSDVVAGAVLGASWSWVASRMAHLWSSADEREPATSVSEHPAGNGQAMVLRPAAKPLGPKPGKEAA